VSPKIGDKTIVTNKQSCELKIHQKCIYQSMLNRVNTLMSLIIDYHFQCVLEDHLRQYLWVSFHWNMAITNEYLQHVPFQAVDHKTAGFDFFI